MSKIHDCFNALIQSIEDHKWVQSTPHQNKGETCLYIAWVSLPRKDFSDRTLDRVCNIMRKQLPKKSKDSLVYYNDNIVKTKAGVIRFIKKCQKIAA
jgi:hypothetical protein